MKIDGKSALIGLAAGVIITLTIGAATSQPIGPVGRFKLETTGQNHFAFVIDTATGKVWRGVHDGRSEPDFLKPKLGE